MIGKFIDGLFQNVFEPSLAWAIAHPIVSVVIVAVLLYWAMRGYRML